MRGRHTLQALKKAVVLSLCWVDKFPPTQFGTGFTTLFARPRVFEGLFVQVVGGMLGKERIDSINQYIQQGD